VSLKKLFLNIEERIKVDQIHNIVYSTKKLGETSKYIPKASIDKLSYTAIPLKILSDQTDSQTEKTLGTATGFIYEYQEKYYLITNWHVVTGLNNETNVCPNLIEFPLQSSTKPFIRWKRYKVNLYADQEMGVPNWFVHPEFKEKVDVVALKIDIPKEILVHPINGIEFDQIKPAIADDIYILGFPYSYTGGGNFPIWKRGSIASEPDIDLDGLPKILVDTASRSGMSGAPVIYRRRGIHNLNDGRLTDESVFGEIQGFIGIYSGRLRSGDDYNRVVGKLGWIFPLAPREEV